MSLKIIIKIFAHDHYSYYQLWVHYCFKFSMLAHLGSSWSYIVYVASEYFALSISSLFFWVVSFEVLLLSILKQLL